MKVPTQYLAYISLVKVPTQCMTYSSLVKGTTQLILYGVQFLSLTQFNTCGVTMLMQLLGCISGLAIIYGLRLQPVITADVKQDM